MKYQKKNVEKDLKVNLNKIEEMNTYITTELAEIYLALEGTNSDYKEMVVDKVEATLNIFVQIVDAMKADIASELDGVMVGEVVEDDN